MSHPWLCRRPLPAPGLDTAKDNLRDTVERWSEREPTPPSQVTVEPQLPPNISHSDVTPQLSTLTQSTDVLQLCTESQPVTKATPAPTLTPVQNAKSTFIKNVKESGDKVKINTQEEEKNKSNKTSTELSTNTTQTETTKSKDTKQAKTEEVNVSTISWAKKRPSITSQTSLPEGKAIHKPFKDDIKSKSENNSSLKLPLKPSSSIADVGKMFTSRIQQGGTEITISKKSLNPSPQPKISGIVLGQTHPRGADNTNKKSLPSEIKPKVITHKIFVEGKGATENPTNEISKGPLRTSQPIDIDKHNHPLLKTLQTDRIERRCSDISCFMHDIDNSTDGMSIINEIKKLSCELFESDMLDKSNNNSSSTLLRQIANRGVAPRRPKFRVTNSNRDVPIGSPPPPTNMTYFFPPNIFSSDSYSSQTHSAPQSPTGSPERSSRNKDVILRLFNKLEEHCDNSTITKNYIINKSQKKVSSISSK